MPRTRLAARLLCAGGASIATVAGLAGCSHTVTVGSSKTLRVALTEYRVIPQSVSSGAGQLTLFVRNDGRLTHNLTVSRGTAVLGQTPPLRPGASAYLVLDLRRGSYLMASSLFSDQILGQYGTLTVR